MRQLFCYFSIALCWFSLSVYSAPSADLNNGALLTPQAALSSVRFIGDVTSKSSDSPRFTGVSWWDDAQQVKDKLVEYANEELNKIASEHPDVAKKVREFKEAMSAFLENIQTFNLETQSLLQIPEFNPEEVRTALNQKVDAIIEQLAEEFKEPLPENQSERYKQREKIVDWALDKLEAALVDVYKGYGVQELDTRERFQGAKQSIKSIVMITGNVIDNHPELAAAIVIAGASLLIPEAWITRPLMRVFGFVPDSIVGWLGSWFRWLFRPLLRLLGWGELGPVKGSAAAWVQRTFYRVAIEKGSWFAWLQKVAMLLK